MKNELQNIWGINFLLCDLSEYVSYLENLIDKDEKIVLNGVNPYSLSLIKKNPEILEALKDSSLANVDGILLKFALQFLGYKVPARLDTPSIFERLMRICQRRKFKIFLLGSKEEELQLIISNLKSEFEGICIVGSHHGFFSNNEEFRVIEHIKFCSPDIILLGMPSPKKEMFIYRNKNNFNFKVSLGVGGVFDIVAGKKRPAPNWVKVMKIEWLYRFMQDPFRLFGRYISMFRYFFVFIFNSKVNMNKDIKNGVLNK